MSARHSVRSVTARTSQGGATGGLSDGDSAICTAMFSLWIVTFYCLN